MLYRKMIRDLWLNKGSYFACAVIVTLGIMIFNMFSIGYDNFCLSEAAYYKEYHFADGFAELGSMPESEVEKLSQIPGITAIEGRLVEDVKITSNEDGSSAYLRLISYDPNQPDSINRFKLLNGEAPLEGIKIVLDNKFYQANGLKLGDSLEVLCSGKKARLEVAGVGQSPEYIYALRTDQEIYPDDHTFGIAFIPEETMGRLFHNTGEINQLSFSIGNNESYQTIEDILKTKLESYGLIKIYARKDQKSNLILNQELNGMKAMSKVMPVLFLLVAVMIMYIMLKRMIEMQRQQIGVLKAFGYTDRAIIVHYISYVIIVGGIGGILGGILGNVMVIPFTGIFQQMFNMPLMKPAFSMEYFIKGLALILGFSLIAGIQGAKGTLKLEPSEAMRPNSPSKTVSTGFRQWKSFTEKLGLNSRMALRNLLRNKGRSIFIFLGMVFTIALLGMPWAMKDILSTMIYDQFEKVQTFDMKITLADPIDYQTALQEMGHYDGINTAEGLLEVPVTLTGNESTKEVVVYGIAEDSKLYHIYDKKKRELSLSGTGIVLSERLAKILDVKAGDNIFLESQFAKDTTQKKEITVEKIVPQYLGLNAYMNDMAFCELLDQSPFVTSVLVKGSSTAIENLKEDYKDSEMVLGMDEHKELMSKYSEMMQMFLSMMGMFCVSGMITGFAVIYASSVITISERRRELASMLVIGMRYKEVLAVVTIEQWIISGLAVIFGIPLMKLMVMGMALQMNNDVYTMPSNISIFAVFTSLGMVAVSIFIAQRVIKRKIDAINLVEALSIKE